MLDRLSGASLSACPVNLIALDSVANAFGDRWQAKQAQVYDHVERVLARALMQGGYFARVSTTDFVVVQPSVGEFAAQALCCRAFDEIWTHFLGKALQTHRSVHRVTEVTGQQITAVEVDPALAIAGEAREAAALTAQGTPTLPPLSALRWTPFVASSGRRVDVVCRLEPVFKLKTYERMGLRLGRKVVDLETGESLRREEMVGLARMDLYRIDMATLSRGLSGLEALEVSERQLSLIVPASFISLTHLPSRQAFLGALAELRPWVRMGLIGELHDLAGAPATRLAEVLSALKPQCLVVAGHFTDPPPASLKDAGLQAVSVTSPHSIDGDAAFNGWLKSWMRAARAVSRSMIVYRCDSPRRMAIARLAGATHAGGAEHA